MIATYVEPRVTALDFEDAASCTRWAMTDTTFSPRLDQLALAMAKNALETGRWKKMYNFNFGNIKAGESYVGMYTSFPCNEIIKGKVRWFMPAGESTKDGELIGERWGVPPGHPQTRFRAYANAWDGSQQYIDVLKTRFTKAWDALLTGDPAKFVSTLKSLNYFTANEDSYLRGVASLQREFKAKLQGLPHEEVIVSDDLYARVEAEHARFFASIWDRPSEEPNV